MLDQLCIKINIQYLSIINNINDVISNNLVIYIDVKISNIWYYNKSKVLRNYLRYPTGYSCNLNIIFQFANKNCTIFVLNFTNGMTLFLLDNTFDEFDADLSSKNQYLQSIVRD